MVRERHQIEVAATVTGKVSVAAEGVRKEDQRRELRRERTATKFL